MYESKGRQYLVVMSPAGGAVQGAAGPDAAAVTGPNGYIAFALPAK
jgi:hypothetical protein